MKKNRLTTRRSTTTDRAVIDSDIKKLLEGPSNFEIKQDGRVFIKSLNITLIELILNWNL